MIGPEHLQRTFSYADLMATARRWEVPLDDSAADYWPSVCGFIQRADDALSILDEHRRQVVERLSDRTRQSSAEYDGRERGLLIGAFWECFLVAHDEQPGAAQ